MRGTGLGGAGLRTGRAVDWMYGAKRSAAAGGGRYSGGGSTEAGDGRHSAGGTIEPFSRLEHRVVRRFRSRWRIG